MNTSRLIEKLEHEVKFLLWKAEIHNLSATEVERCYQQIERIYLSLSEQPQVDLIKYKLADWNREIQKVAHLS
ncbi:MAG: hypothetical protein V7739_00935 [Motiliproteus sp.]